MVLLMGLRAPAPPTPMQQQQQPPVMEQGQMMHNPHGEYPGPPMMGNMGPGGPQFGMPGECFLFLFYSTHFNAYFNS